MHHCGGSRRSRAYATTTVARGHRATRRGMTLVEVMVNEAIKTSEIEGEYLSRQDVMSSIKRNLGFNGDQKQPDQYFKYRAC